MADVVVQSEPYSTPAGWIAGGAGAGPRAVGGVEMGGLSTTPANKSMRRASVSFSAGNTSITSPRTRKLPRCSS